MKILVVDDDPDVILVLKRILKRYGCEVVGVTDSEKCLGMVKKEMPDAIFLDVMMPSMDGWEICKKIKGDPKTSDIFVSMVTVRCEKEDREKSFRYAKANSHLCKPIDFDEVRKVVEDIKSGNPMEINSKSAPPGCFQCS